MSLPVLLGPGEGERRQARGSVMVFKALAATTGGRFSLMERSLPPGGRMPPPHRHLGCEEGFYVLEGEITFILEGEEHVRGPGAFVLVPGGASHTFGNRSDAPARLLIVHAPAMDRYFAELELLWSGAGAPAPEDEHALMARHGMIPG
ncbi:MAG TPA: cupin domain-containing protein [Acidimicrobiales bacterium]|nr:cupin domain-containing protein [Acidimicrobiales bacterium]